jgi:hypothetical protein
MKINFKIIIPEDSGVDMSTLSANNSLDATTAAALALGMLRPTAQQTMSVEQTNSMIEKVTQ